MVLKHSLVHENVTKEILSYVYKYYAVTQLGIERYTQGKDVVALLQLSIER